LNHKLLRELFRHLQAFKALFENEGVDSITSPTGEEYFLYDIDYLYECTQTRVRLTPVSPPEYLLSPRQRQAIELFLYCNIREKDVAVLMGVSDTNPIAIYATQGLNKLCALINSGQLSRYRPVLDGGMEHANSLWGEPAAGGDGQRADPPVAGRGDGPLSEGGHPDAMEGTRPSEPRSLQLVGHGRPGDAAGDVPPRVEFTALPPELTRWRRAPAPDPDGTGGVRGQGVAVEPVLAGRPEPAGIDQRLYRLTIRWGKQVRLKCAQCTKYIKGGAEGHLHCSCGCAYRQVQDDYYEMIEVDRDAAVA
jgi:hypothetical protein